MALPELTQPAIASTAAYRAVSGLANLWNAFAVWNDARITRNALSQLSAHERDDIGISQSDIDAIANRRRR